MQEDQTVSTSRHRRILHRSGVLDDAHRNQDAFEFAKMMAASPIDHPILVVMCVNGIAIEAGAPNT